MVYSGSPAASVTEQSRTMTTQYIKTAAVRKAVKAAGKRTSTEYLDALDRYVERAIQRAIAEHNGGKKTITADVAGHTLGNR